MEVVELGISGSKSREIPRVSSCYRLILNVNVACYMPSEICGDLFLPKKHAFNFVLF